MRITVAGCVVIVWLVMSYAAPAATASPVYRCKGERIEKGSSTWGHARCTGSDYRIEKGSSSIAWAKRRGSKWSIETFGGSTLGWLDGDRIERPNGSTWARLSDARCLVRDGPDAVAAALWVLDQHGRLRCRCCEVPSRSNIRQAGLGAISSPGMSCAAWASGSRAAAQRAPRPEKAMLTVSKRMARSNHGERCRT